MPQLSHGSIPCQTLIQGIYPEFSAAERALADFVLGNAKEAVHLTIEQLARRSSVSYSTTCRFCKKLGFQGFKAFRAALTEDILHQAEVGETAFSEFEVVQGESYEQICGQSFRLFTGILSDCASLLNLATLAKAVEAISTARTLYVIGAGASAASAMYAYTRFLRLGNPCSFDTDPTLYRMKCALMQPGDILVAISSSGRTSAVVEAAKLAGSLGAQVISISDYTVSPLQKHSHIPLYTTARNAGMHLNVDMPLIIGQIAIIDILYSCCLAYCGAQGQENYLRTKAAADTTKSK